MVEKSVLNYSKQLAELGIENTILEHPSLKTPKETLGALGLTMSDGSSTLIMKTDKEFVAVIRRDDCQLDFEKLKKEIGVKTIRMATADEFGEITGLPVGAARVFNPNVKTYIDEKIFEKEYLVGGSGNFVSSIRSKTEDLKKIPQSSVVDVTTSTKKRVLSGIRATGRLHLGNYLGAVKGMLELQNDSDYETLYMVADVHTITTPYDIEQLRNNRREIIIDYLAAGLNPEKSILFQQSMVPQHIELAFYFSSVVTIAKMQHLPTFKDKVKQYPQNATMALLNYPILMTSDILVYKAGLVPVGIDQEPHLEVAREIARSMNQKYDTDFPEPKRFATKGEYIPSLTGEGKMSKSVEGSYINLTDSFSMIRSKVAKIPTDSGKSTDVSSDVNFQNVLQFVKILIGDTRVEELKKEYQTTGVQYKEVKDELAEAIYKELQPLQEKRAELESNPEYVDKIIAEGAEKARAVAENTVIEVKEKMGLA